MAIYKDVESLEVVAYKGESDDFDRGVTFILEKLDALPVADVVAVRHGKWLYVSGEEDMRNMSVASARYMFVLMKRLTVPFHGIGVVRIVWP